MKAISLKCVNCGAGLEIGPDTTSFACGYCGTQQLVERGGGIVSLRRLEDTLDEVKLGTNRAASELALARLKAEAAAICAQRDNEIRAIRASDDRGSTLLGWGIIIGVIAAIAMFGWWSIPIVAFGLFFVVKFAKSASGDVKKIAATAEEKLAPLNTQIARHQKIIDAYDFH